MKSLFALLGLLLAGVAGAAEIERVGKPDLDKVFAEVASLDNVLDAAEGRIGRLTREVAGSMGLGATTPMALTVWTIKDRAGGDVRVMNVEGRPIVALGMNAPGEAKDAAGVLNEGTQEVSVMATDLSRLPGHIEKLASKAKGLPGADDPAVTRNLAVTAQVQKRAAEVAERARVLLDDVRKGIEAAEKPAAPAPTPAPAAKERPKPAPAQTIPEVLSKAWVAVKQDDLKGAKALLDKADLLLPRQVQPVSRGDLVELFQMRAHVNLLTGDATAAAWAATQALTVHPGGEPLSKLGTEYAKLHRALAKADIVRKVDVLVTGDGRAYLSGNELGRGSTAQLGQGQHLLQIQRGDVWESSVVYVRDGFVVEL
ncbi:MAG: hypothetical protein KC656_19845 [Myxococcales bacterium]|nr:hypothetical protein [Myxococcales bacterium]MCB9669083.1 hypothetical protein [Alphaproteobacteria bacterium]